MRGKESMDPTRHQFQVRPADLGDRLIWRFPLATPEGREALRAVIAATGKDPQTVTVGYYLDLDDPEGAPVFMPVNSPQAKAALTVAAVQRRIASDLIERLERAPRNVYCEKCDRRVVPRQDAGDDLCPVCGLVL